MLADLSPSFVNVEENASVRIFFFFFLFSSFTFTRKKKASTNDLYLNLNLSCVSIELTNIHRTTRVHLTFLPDISSMHALWRLQEVWKKKKQKFDHESSLILSPRSLLTTIPLSKVRTEWWCESSKAPWFLLYIYIIYVYNIYV